MDFDFTPEQLSIRQMARDFGEKESGPMAEHDQKEEFPWDVAAKMAPLGMMGGTIPVEYGGAGLDYMSFALMTEELAVHDMTISIIMSFASGLGGQAILQYGTEAQKQKYLVPVCQGDIFCGTALTEPRSGSDVGGTETSVRKDGSDYVINGQKMWISFISEATFFTTFATMDRSLKHRGLCAFIIPADTPGVTRKPFKNKVGYRPLSTGELTFDNARIPQENLLGEEGGGFKVAMCAVENGRLSVASRACGVAQACLNASVKYAQERVVFEQPIGRFQLIQSKITDMVVNLEAARLLTYNLAWIRDKGTKRAQRESSIAKMFATDMLMKTSTDTMQIYGAYSCSPEYPVGRYWRDSKFFQFVEGTSEIHRILIAEYAMGYRKER